MRKWIVLYFIIIASEAYPQIYFNYVMGNANVNRGLSYMQYVPRYKEVFGCGPDGQFACFDLYGDMQWIISTGSHFHLNFAIAKNGDFMLCGVYNGGGANKLSLVRVDSAGNILNSLVYSASRLLDAKIIRADDFSDEYLIKCWYLNGGTNDDIGVIRIKGSGKILWQYRYADGSADEQTGGIVSDGAGGAYVSGLSIMGGGRAFLGHINAEGEMTNISYYGNAFGPADNMIRCSDGGFLLTGVINMGAGANREPFALKLESDGAVQWCTAYHNAQNNTAYGYSGNCSATEGKFGDYYIAGLSSDETQLHLRVMKIQPDGTISWIKDGELSSSLTYYETSITHIPKDAHEIFWVSDRKQYADLGFGSSDLIMDAEDADFTGCIWTEIYPDIYAINLDRITGSVSRYTTALPRSFLGDIPDPVYDQIFLCNGILHPVGSDARVVLPSADWIQDSLQVIRAQQEMLKQDLNTTQILVYPNPATDVLQIRMQYISSFEVFIYDNAGRLVYTATCTSDHIRIPVGDMPEGLYHISCVSKSGISFYSGSVLLTGTGK